LTTRSRARHATQPKNNRAFWQRKLAANKTRDRVVTRTLRAQGWRVLRIWEHELQKAMKRSTPHLASGHPPPFEAERVKRNYSVAPEFKKLCALAA
jgi:hypothetical protein